MLQPGKVYQPGEAGQQQPGTGMFNAENLRAAAEESLVEMFSSLIGFMCRDYFYWFWIIIAILIGLLLSVDIRLHDILKHIPKKELKKFYEKKKRRRK